MEGALTAVSGAHPPQNLPAQSPGVLPLQALPHQDPEVLPPQELPPPAAAPPAVGGGTALRGARCPDCAVAVYPADPACPRCGGPALPVTLSGAGTLWTWTVQRYAPKSPPYKAPEDGFRPFAVGYVELPEGVRVLAVLDGVHPEDVEIGMPVTVTAGDGVPRARRADPAGVAT